ncbi:hypothetical protein COCSUDRAFT_57518 [Coccomyxa subellipsoidea C-169]|uniref:Uncharacterized protein n=1 Tax=Coccomyxa subellipsoidea (strain C-169) TaxID=574566 RepID=I0YPP7_COCSC|nr:hypothetical protein COCSUDRAFT_57518 [Coccomyxa subellipsoidea C-169]EIE20366.1 hypothetical protein COCSUDRAFT_57518 [Coccomyxa subellipsoidea C-169]|eukprot:XP_005644910.1 hypothetical protein COCSUDRAFT_57518 [Coccomyxa subellipsoidea C-169]
MNYIEVAVWTRWCLFAAVLGTALSLASAELTAGGLAALPSSFQGDVTDRAAGLKSWGKLLGQAVIFNQAGDASRGAYSLESLIQKAQHQIILQAAGLAKNTEQKAPLQFNEEKANENPLEKWTRVLVEEANAQAKKAFGKAYSTLNRAGKAAFSAFNPTGAEAATEASNEEQAGGEETELPPFIKDAELFELGAPSVFSYEWEPISTTVAGVDLEVNIFNIAPCAVVLDASGVKVENTLIKVEPMLIHINPKAVNVEASLIEVAPKLISVSPYGAALNIELPRHIHVEGSAIEVSPVGEETEFGPGADAEG